MKNKFISSFIFLYLFCAVLEARVEVPISDQMILQILYKNTWSYIDYFVNDLTGFPYDSHEKKPSTSLTNIGFYMASCAIASQTGLIPKEDANLKLKKCLHSLKLMEKWRNFPVTWVNAYNLKTTEQQFSTIDHLGNLSASLILVKNIYPELAPAVDEILSPMNWSILYEEKNHFYRGGYRLDKMDFDIKQPWGDWYYSFLGADTRLGSFIGIAKGEIPYIQWQSLNRNIETKYGQNYFVPGWQGGGLFMQFVSGLFLDERTTVLGKSAANFAYAQILHARKIQAKVWGWSASQAPTGEYLGWGAIKDEIVTPHASLLAINYYPNKVMGNVKELDKLGASSPYMEMGKKLNFGFRDSLNWKIGFVSSGYLALDQTMIFLSLANYLYDGMVWKNFKKDPMVQKGLESIEDYSRIDSQVLQVYQKRDQEEPNEHSIISLE
ncbi:MAG: hypothetical protein A3I11_04860 [Elusimicrobia bacterium RIFCSPLOWO2_02_FULL_39_32]|nr:MAG: hypothetical protein A2034_07855 [Elusimicrobia bacterium GWA2_38_7]OGR80116.1 MAG: hypothetical protein A3B80_00745 [Elusimicrobia bacterium RIFCSPHIGHO2_02_FULL_39_36]OGR91089.1 MAG: hypothetical protein A3I11_04860 [Elusimicrobia bacterium RIFCSPLOWO2_02_FULL_39_32]OGS00056.1 MAG: hypothetical protein A3G85_07825 [Elusimicrobia bacterium RIFCSPLOWO2_12_FULL_39_28]